MSADLEQRLRSLLGLNKYQASAYLVLLKAGPMRPQEVAKQAGVPVQRIYDTLRSLQEMGLVVEREGVFEAVDPLQSLGALAKREVARALKRASEIDALAKDLSSSAPGARPAEVTLVRGLDSVMGAALATASSCNERPVFLAHKVFERLSVLLPALKELVRSSGPGALVVVPKGYLKRYRQEAEELSGYGLRVVESDAAFLDLMVACDTVIIGVPYGGDAIAVVIKSREFAEGLRKGLLNLLSSAP
ncbi:MAG: hypothetical protein L7G97_04505 [Acidilobus sp.]|nr:hypothetical protein [Acidilobus sp.]MCG2890038.1 hypothetical protein [Acidilobus sp.]